MTLYNSEMADLGCLTAIIEREDDGYVALCPEYDIASEGATIEQAHENLVEAPKLFFGVRRDNRGEAASTGRKSSLRKSR